MNLTLFRPWRTIYMKNIWSEKIESHQWNHIEWFSDMGLLETGFIVYRCELELFGI